MFALKVELISVELTKTLLTYLALEVFFDVERDGICRYRYSRVICI